MLITVPVERSSGPGDPIPTPANRSRAIRSASMTSRIASSIMDTTRSTTNLGPLFAPVGSVPTASGWPPSSGTTPTLIVVPPMSTPTTQSALSDFDIAAHLRCRKKLSDFPHHRVHADQVEALLVRLRQEGAGSTANTPVPIARRAG